MNLMNVPGMFVCSSFLISVCMFIVSKYLLISSATVIVRAGAAIWLNQFFHHIKLPQPYDACRNQPEPFYGPDCSSMHGAMEEDSLMTQYDDDDGICPSHPLVGLHNHV